MGNYVILRRWARLGATFLLLPFYFCLVSLSASEHGVPRSEKPGRLRSLLMFVKLRHTTS